MMCEPHELWAHALERRTRILFRCAVLLRPATNHIGVFYAIPDYLAIGGDGDYFLEPMTPILAQRLCDRLVHRFIKYFTH